MSAAASIAVDVGGSFTDLVARLSDGRVVTGKVPSTPDDPSRALVQGVVELAAAAGVAPALFDVLLHGTTVATNAILQRRGAVTGLVTTEGFRDVLAIARQARPRLFDLDPARPEPLVPRALRVEVRERMDVAGATLTAVDAVSLAAAAATLRAADVEAIAVVLLHAYASAAHEEAVLAALAAALPGVHLSRSSEVQREYREYERTSTTVINAYVAPLMERYLRSMADRLTSADVRADVRVMQSNGGLMTLERAARLPAATIMSGVAAGAVGGAAIGSAAGRPTVVTLDMGGTSTDMALAMDGAVRAVRTHEIDGLPIRLPALDVHTIGAGGGSVAEVDGSGLRVGPRSAGATPGPAAYGAGGTEPTVTDANLVLGRLPPVGLLGGRLPLHRDLAEAAIETVATPLGLGITEAAEGIIRIVNARMARQIRVLIVERGTDPRSCALVAFGGGGPVHAVELAQQLGMECVVIPPNPGVTSAVGLLLSDLRVDAVQTAMLEVSQTDPPDDVLLSRLRDLFASAESAALADLPTGGGDAPTVRREVEARYRRQGHELRVRLPNGPIDAAFVGSLVRAFAEVHRNRYGYDVAGEPVVVVNVLVTATAPFSLAIADLAPQGETAALPSTSRSVLFGGVAHETRILPRSSLRPGESLTGPAILEQYDTTTVVPPGTTCRADAHGFLTITWR